MSEIHFNSAEVDQDSITLTLRGRLAQHIVHVLGDSASTTNLNATRDVAVYGGLQPRLVLTTRAKRELAQRRLRAELFGKAMFGEPPWEALLALYVDGGRFTISQVVEACGMPPTTMLRWLVYLEDSQLIQRESHPTDGRAVFVKLTEKGSTTLDSYFSETLVGGR